MYPKRINLTRLLLISGVVVLVVLATPSDASFWKDPIGAAKAFLRNPSEALRNDLTNLADGLEQVRARVERTIGQDAIKIWDAALLSLQVIIAHTLTIPAGGIPIPGPHCGPELLRPLIWLAPDGYFYGTKKVSFADACKVHDACYSKTSTTSQAECDRLFLIALRNECRRKLTALALLDCLLIAGAYFSLVSEWGHLAYDSKQEMVALLSSVSLPTSMGKVYQEKVCTTSHADAFLSVRDRVASPDGYYYVVMQGDGRLVQYSDDGVVGWATETDTDADGADKTGYRFAVQRNGRWAVYDGAGAIAKTSESSGPAGIYCLVVQNDSNIVLQNERGQVVWSLDQDVRFKEEDLWARFTCRTDL